MTDKRSTRFKPGQSGNPAGRRPGSGWVGSARQALQSAWDGQKPDGSDGIRAALLTKAKDGDMAAIRIVAERVCPGLRPTEDPLAFDLPDGTLTEKANAILRAMAAGELPPGSASQLLGALGAVAKAIETDELVRRIAALEDKHAKP